MAADNSHFPGGRKVWATLRDVDYTNSSGETVRIKSGDVYIGADGQWYQWRISTYINPISGGASYSVGWNELSTKDIDRLRYNTEGGFNLLLDNSDGGWKEEKEIIEIKVGPLGGQFNKALAKRWPLDMIDEETDWVLFQFGKYPKPFGRDVAEIVGVEGQENQIAKLKGLNQLGLSYYNQSAAALQVNGPPVMLPIPQDVANEIQQTWQGKQFTALGRAAVAATAAGRFADIQTVLKNVSGNLVGLQKSLTGLALNTLPGVGGNISFNDLAGTTRGVVINPNAELLYDSPQMREVGMVFKMVASNRQESEQIRSICRTFRMNASPQYGGMDENDPEEWQKTKDLFVNLSGGKKEEPRKNDWGDMHNFIRVPILCIFSFMKGHQVHPWLVQFKPCAISNVEVNYTPDGTYATHPDGAPVAVEIRLSFMETKVVFAQEIGDGF